MTAQNTRLGIWLMIGTMLVFAAQDGVSRYLATEYNVFMVVMVRYWFFALFVIALAKRNRGSIADTARSKVTGWQIFRGVLLASEVCVMVTAFTLLGLIESHAVFASYPLLVAALSGPILGEHVGWRRWVAILFGFIGVMIILRPGFGLFSPAALVPLLAALMFAVYNLLTRFVARTDSAATSYFYTGIAGAGFMTMIGIWYWQPMAQSDWGWMGLLCVLSTSGHWMLIKCYDVAEVSVVQPFAFLQLVFAAGFGVFLFSETLQNNVIIGVIFVVSAGVFTLVRARKAATN